MIKAEELCANDKGVEVAEAAEAAVEELVVEVVEVEVVEVVEVEVVEVEVVDGIVGVGLFCSLSVVGVIFVESCLGM